MFYSIYLHNIPIAVLFGVSCWGHIWWSAPPYKSWNFENLDSWHFTISKTRILGIVAFSKSHICQFGRLDSWYSNTKNNGFLTFCYFENLDLTRWNIEFLIFCHLDNCDFAFSNIFWKRPGYPQYRNTLPPHPQGPGSCSPGPGRAWALGVRGRVLGYLG